MGRKEWTANITCFQARCRGYLTRRELKRVQADYEDIVRELEGGVEHLSWRGQCIPRPHFTDADMDNAFLTYPKLQTQKSPESVKLKNQECPESVKLKNQECPESVEKVKNQDDTPEILVSARDDQSGRDCRETSALSGSNTESDKVQRDGMPEKECLNFQMNHNVQQLSHPMCSLLENVAHTPEALKQHRNTLAMELLWIQQAIASRKKYLTLKQKLEMS